MWPNLLKSFQIPRHQHIAYHCTISFQPKLWSTYSRLIGSKSEFTVMWKARMAASGSGKCLGWLYPVLLLLISPNIHTVDCASFQPLRSQHNPSRLVFELHWCPTTILNCKLFPPVYPPPPTQWKHPWYYLVVNFFCYLAGTSVSSN